jgi:AcrR family transcriptional regulator
MQSARTLDEIASLAGVSREAIHLRFGSRTVLLTELARGIDEAYQSRERLAAVSATDTGVDALAELISFWVEYAAAIRPFVNELAQARLADTAAAAELKLRRTALRDVCDDVASKLDRDGSLSLGWDQTDASDFLWAVLSLSLDEEVSGPPRQGPCDQQAGLAGLVARTLLGRRASSQLATRMSGDS